MRRRAGHGNTTTTTNNCNLLLLRFCYTLCEAPHSHSCSRCCSCYRSCCYYSKGRYCLTRAVAAHLQLSCCSSCAPVQLLLLLLLLKPHCSYRKPNQLLLLLLLRTSAWRTVPPCAPASPLARRLQTSSPHSSAAAHGTCPCSSNRQAQTQQTDQAFVGMLGSALGVLLLLQDLPAAAVGLHCIRPTAEPSSNTHSLLRAC